MSESMRVHNAAIIPREEGKMWFWDPAAAAPVKLLDGQGSNSMDGVRLPPGPRRQQEGWECVCPQACVPGRCHSTGRAQQVNPQRRPWRSAAPSGLGVCQRQASGHRDRLRKK